MRIFLIAVITGGCGFNASGPTEDAAPIDSSIDGPPDATLPCASVGRSCAADVLVDCQVMDEPPMQTPCAWGCTDSGGARCKEIMPSGGAVMPSDLVPDPGLQPVTFSGTTVINGDTGQITGGFTRAAGSNILSGVSWTVRGDVAVFGFRSLTIDGGVTFTGPNDKAVAFVANGPIVVNATLDALGSCSGTARGPGGDLGGSGELSGVGAGAGAGANNDQGGGGAGHGGAGGAGGAGASGGVAFGTDPLIAVLVGGSGGGSGGGGGGAGVGGGGGAAIQLVSNQSISIPGGGGINAGGCGGGAGGGGGGDAGGGGGAGGAILVEAPIVTVAGTLAVNGGSGATKGDNGNRGRLDRVRATGGTSTTFGDGGLGGAGLVVVGASGTGASTFGGGGGGVGRIRINTKSGTASLANATLSPGLDETVPPRCTQGAAVVN